MEVLLWSLYGATAVMAVPRRCRGGQGGAAAVMAVPRQSR